MNQVFDVYSHGSKGTWGFSVAGSEVWTAEIKPSGVLKLERIEAIRLGGLLTKRVRMGYTRAIRSKYLHQTLSPAGEVFGAFGEIHPDVQSPEGSALVLMVTKPIGEVDQKQLEEWETTFQQVSGIREESATWIKKQERAQQYFVAHDQHPAFALVLADWALRNKQIVLCQKGVVPTSTPQSDPLAWTEFLAMWFTKEKVQKALEQLGWSLRDALLKPVFQPDENNNALDTDSWIAEAGQAAF